MKLISILLVFTLADGHNVWIDKRVIVHLFEWKWKDVAEECERFLAPNGYGAVQISPPTENLIMHTRTGQRPWYERYQVMSYQLVTRSGGEEELLDMTRRCNKVGVRVYADIIFNHMTQDMPADSVGTAGSTADFGNFYYPGVPYTWENFHYPHCNLTDFEDLWQVKNCQLCYLKDLNQTQEVVRDHIVTFMNRLIDLGISGLRVDASKHMEMSDLRVIYNRLNNLNTDFGFPPNTRPYIYQEFVHYGKGPILPDEYVALGDVTEFRASIELADLFRGNNPLSWITGWGPKFGRTGFLPGDAALVFVDNHDIQRSLDILTYKEPRAYRAASAFLLSHPYGNKRVMSSYFFTDHEVGPPSHNDEILPVVINSGKPIMGSPGWVCASEGRDVPEDGTCDNGWVCEHRWPEICRMVGFANIVGNTSLTHWWDNGDKQIAYGRENKGFIVINGEEDLVLNTNLQTGLPPGTYCDVISGEKKDGGCTGKTITVNENGQAQFFIPKHARDMHIAIHVGAEISHNPEDDEYGEILEAKQYMMTSQSRIQTNSIIITVLVLVINSLL